MATTNCDFSRSPLLSEQYQRDMELIAVAFKKKVRTNVKSALSSRRTLLVSHQSACFHAQLEN